MPNTFITPTVIARTGLATLYHSMVLAALVWRDFDSDFTGKQGDTITIRKPAVFTAEEFNRTTGITLQSITENSMPLALDKIANVSVPVTDEEMTLKIEDFETQVLNGMVAAIAEKIDGDLAEAVVDAAEGGGGGGTVNMDTPNPVASSAYRKARARLGRNKIPTTDRHSVLSPEATSVALGDPLLIKVNESGATQALREGVIGRLLGFNTYESGVFGFGPGDRGQADGVAFHRHAVTLAVRPLQEPRGVASNQVARENFGGVSMRVVYSYDNNKKQDEVSVDVLYGIAKTRPEGAVQLDFGQGS